VRSASAPLPNGISSAWRSRRTVGPPLLMGVQGPSPGPTPSGSGTGDGSPWRTRTGGALGVDGASATGVREHDVTSGTMAAASSPPQQMLSIDAIYHIAQERRSLPSRRLHGGWCGMAPQERGEVAVGAKCGGGGPGELRTRHVMSTPLEACQGRTFAEGDWFSWPSEGARWRGAGAATPSPLFSPEVSARAPRVVTSPELARTLLFNRGRRALWPIASMWPSRRKGRRPARGHRHRGGPRPMSRSDR
jgi:hypothetical protein